MKRRTALILLVALTLTLLLIGTLARGAMGERLAVHWNVQGQADGYGSTFTAIYLLPLVILATGLLIQTLPTIDPLKSNIQRSGDAVNRLVLSIAAFLGYLYLLTIAWNLGWAFDFNQVLMPAMAALMWAVGGLLPNARRNWFIGIRTPWTLSSDLVWEKTHRLGGSLFKGVAVLSLSGVFFPAAAVFFLMVPIMLVIFALVVYSWVAYRQLEAAG